MSILRRHILLNCFPSLYTESHKTSLDHKAQKIANTSNISIRGKPFVCQANWYKLKRTTSQKVVYKVFINLSNPLNVSPN